jgi:hypothetical protein
MDGREMGTTFITETEGISYGNISGWPDKIVRKEKEQSRL